MRASFITRCLATALVLAAAPLLFPRAASAADLYGEGYAEPPPYEDNAYDEGAYGDEDGPPPRYADRYGEAPSPDGDDELYDAVEPAPGSIKDGYPVPMPPPRVTERLPERYAPDRYAPERYACLDRWQIRRALHREGWSDIRPMGGDGRVVKIRARRFDSSSVFRLRVDRCSGRVLAARPDHLRSYAYRERRWRY